MAAATAAERVLVVDDDQSLRRMLERSLLAEGFAVQAVADGGAALAAIERSAPDLVVLDVALPGMDGLAVCRRLRDKGIGLPVLMLTARDAVADRVAGLEVGADDYLVKPFATEELVARLRALMRRGAGTGQRLTVAELTLDLDTRELRRAGRLIELTAREAALLELMMRAPRRVVTREQALADVWRDEASVGIVDAYIMRLRAKLGAPQVIRTVRGSGFMLEA
jgi:two-component system, OmpR family, response regulator MprA